MDDIPPAVRVAPTATVTGVRAYLPGQAPPFPASSFITAAVVDAEAVFGADGDEFPITWGQDGMQYTGAGDNTQPSPGINASYASPMSFFRVSGQPTDSSFPDRSFTVLGPFSLSKKK